MTHSREIAMHGTAGTTLFSNCTSYNQSINQSIFYSANIPGVARLSGATARSVFKYKVVEAIP